VLSDGEMKENHGNEHLDGFLRKRPKEAERGRKLKNIIK